MSVHIVQLGSRRQPGEGPRLGTVRLPPRGVPKAEFATRDFYDVWLPNLAPSRELLRSIDRSQSNWWRRFSSRFKAEMKRPEASGVLDTLAALSHHTHFSIGCYCDDEERCHRSILRELLAARGAALSR
jgi:uncharacterized protein YeaO (DUF488 family)